MSDDISCLKKEWSARAKKFGNSKRSVLFKRFPTYLNNYIHRRHIKFCLSSMAPKTISVLEPGCGFGRISQEIKAISINKIKFQGVEICSEFAQSYIDNVGPCFIGSIQEYQPSKKYDSVIVVTLLMYLECEERDKVLRKLWDAVADNGRLIVIEPATELFVAWRRLTGKENAAPTGGNVGSFYFPDLASELMSLSGARIVDGSSIYLLPLLNMLPVHHCVAVEKVR